MTDIDKLEKSLSEELLCKIAIRDAKFISTYINVNVVTVGAFHSYLEPAIEFLYRPGASPIGEQSREGIDRTVAVFLRQEVDRADSNASLMASIADGLILWALRDTDPEQGKLLTRAETLGKIEEAIPSAKSLIRGTFNDRIQKLASKNADGGRQVRFYGQQDSFCLPYETRKLVAVENAADDLLRLQVSCVFEDRLAALGDAVSDDIRATIVSTCHLALEQIFEHQGMKLAQFIHNAEVDDELYTNVAAFATGCVERLDLSSEEKGHVRRFTLHVLRGTFYRSAEVERVYLGKLSRTYVLMLLLRNDLAVVEHFSRMAGKFYLYVGTDILVRALSELYLDAESQTTINLLKIVKDAGSKLVLTEKTVEEVVTHIRAQVLEFENHYQGAERFIKLDAVEYIDRLLIRAYLYARLAPIPGVEAPRSWRAYIENFGDYRSVRNQGGKEEIAAYLTRKFGLVYESTREMLEGVDQDELDLLTADIKEAKERGGLAKERSELLAFNDALHVLRVYNRRVVQKEESPANPFGFRTWWLTQDQRVRRGAYRAVADHGGKFFMLRPEFILNYISFAPSKAEVRESYKAVFPSVLGVRLSSGLKSKIFGRVMRSASEVARVDEARAAAMVTTLTERLKSDSARRFDAQW